MGNCGTARTDTPLPSEDPIYGQRLRAFVDPFPGWNASVYDVWAETVQPVTVPANTVQQELVSYVVPRNAVAYFDGFGQDAICPAFADVTWQIVIGGRVYLTFGQTAQVGSYLQMYPLHMPVTGGVKVAVLATTGANQRDLAAALRGICKPLDTASPEQA